MVRPIVGKTLYRLGLSAESAARPVTDGSLDASNVSQKDTVSGLILAGAQPWGVCALESLVPRALAPLANQPLLTHVLAWFAQSGVRSSVICGNTYTELLKRKLAQGLVGPYVPRGIDIQYYEDISPRGPAGCIKDVASFTDADTFIAVDGSLMPQCDLTDLLEAHRARGAEMTVAVSPERRGCDPITDRRIPMGIYILNRSVVEFIAEAGYQDIKESLIPELYRKDRPVLPFMVDVPAPRVRNVDSYLAANAWCVETHCASERQRNHYRIQGYRFDGLAGVHESSRINGTARCIGPVLIAENVTVAEHVTIVGPVSIGSGSRIERGAVVTRSVIWENAVVGANAFIDRSIVAVGAAVPNNQMGRYAVFSQSKLHDNDNGSVLRTRRTSKRHLRKNEP